MRRTGYALSVGLIGLALTGSNARAAPLLSPGDLALAVDLDVVVASSYPPGEAPALAIDGNVSTKYLNFAERSAGFIVTPAVGSTTVRSFQLTTANDVPARDPASWELYGTNDVITSADNSAGSAENWTLIDSGNVALPDARNVSGPVVPVNNSTGYGSYRLVFPTVKDSSAANSVQIAEVEFFQTSDGSGIGILSPGDPILAVHLGSSQSSSPLSEGPANAVDANPNTKYLNFGEANAGLILAPSIGPSIVTSFVITTANDSSSRDPAGWALYGTNDPIMSTDHSPGDAELWNLIDSGLMDLPLGRLTAGASVPVDNSEAYSGYRFIVTSVRDGPSANSMQFAEIQLDGQVAGSAPEPAAWLLLVLALSALAASRRRASALLRR
jgi:hypothetical protein